MSMTREEAIEYFESLLKRFEEMRETETSYWGKVHTETTIEATRLALSSLRPVSREQVRRGTIIKTIKDGRANRVFSCCGRDFTELTCWYMPDFCPACGAPMTDEAVDILLRRLEVLHEADLI